MLSRWHEIQLARELIPPDSASSSDDERPLVKRRPAAAELQEFMKVIKEIRQGVELVNAEANKLETLNIRVMSSTSSKEIAEIELEVQVVTQVAKQLLRQTKGQLRELAAVSQEEDEKKYQAVQRKFVRSSIDRVVKKYLSIQGRLRESIQSRCVEITQQATGVSQEEARRFVAAGLSAEKAQNLKYETPVDEEIAVAEADDARKMEIAMAEVHALLVDLSALVETQGDQLDSIEAEVTKAKEYAVKTGKKLEVAVKRDRRKMRAWIWCISIALLILLIYAIIHALKDM